MRRPIAIISIGLLFISTFPQVVYANSQKAILACIRGFESVGREIGKKALQKIEEESLAAFDAAMVDPQSVAWLSKNVYSVKTASGSKYVVRIGDGHNFVEREVFAASFLNQTPLVKVPVTKLLSEEQAREVLSKIPGKSDVAPASVSIAPFYPLIDGKKVLENVGRAVALRNRLEMLAGYDTHKMKAHGAMFRDLAKNEWNKQTPEFKKSLEDDLRRLFPEAKDSAGKPLKGKKLQEFVWEILFGPNPSPEKRGRFAQLKSPLAGEMIKLDRSTQIQLADHWVTYSTVGLGDFHSMNWLAGYGQVFGIDPAVPDKLLGAFVGPLSDTHPFGTFALSGEQRKQIFDLVSPEVKTYLTSLTRADVERIANESNFDLAKADLDAIVARIENLKTIWK